MSKPPNRIQKSVLVCPECGSTGLLCSSTCMACIIGPDRNSVACRCHCGWAWGGKAYMIDGTPKSEWPCEKKKLARLAKMLEEAAEAYPSADLN